MNYIQKEKTGNLIFTIQAKEGGFDAKNFVYILFKMYTKFLYSKHIKFDLVDKYAENEDLISSFTLRIINDKTLINESGICKLIRKSPYDSNFKRQTSFCEVSILEEENINFQLKLSDCRIDTYRASGKGGQNVNKVETAVRVTHIPTKLVVTCQNNRDQLANKQEALIELEKRLKILLQINQQKLHQSEIVKTFVFDPDKYVKLHKLGKKLSKLDLILSGDISIFFEN